MVVFSVPDRYLAETPGGWYTPYDNSMKLFTRLFVAMFVLEALLFAINAASHRHHPSVYFLIIPAILIAMAVGGVHSAGFMSLLVGMVATALVYGAIAAAFLELWSKLFHKRTMLSAEGHTSR